ncbi:MAG: hydroxymethylbilane synthase [bacterium]|nr:hydroxymethylbilane synthase [bacterium]
MSLTLATRGSPLALWQAHTTRDRLASIADRSDVELVKVVSSGDADRVSDIARFGRIGVFTVEVDRAVLDGRAQAGVHSLKDMTTTLEDGVMLAAVLPRGPVEDVLISRSGAVLKDLPRGARVATGSMRREAMVRRARPDLEITGVRGNVDTRLAKLAAGEADALVVARAGLVRLGLSSQITEVLDTQRFLPAVGQGIVGLTCRADDDATAAVLRAIGDEDAWAAATAERALLRTLHGGCNVPVGGHATLGGGELRLAARVLSTDGSRVLEGERSGTASDAEAIGSALGAELLAAGAAELFAEARA